MRILAEALHFEIRNNLALYLLQQMTAQRSDPMTAKPDDPDCLVTLAVWVALFTLCSMPYAPC